MPQSKTSLPVNQLQPNPFQPRDKIQKDDIAELIKSVEMHGVIEPLIVANTPAGYQIIAGERRWRAAKAAGLEEVPVHIRKTTPRQMLEIALIENLQREDLNPLERAQGFQRLMTEFNFTKKKIADSIGKSRDYVYSTLILLDLPDKIKDAIIDGKFTEGHARAIAGIQSEEKMIEAYEQLVTEDATVRDAEQLAREIKAKEPPPPGSLTRPKPANLDDKIKELEEKVKNFFVAPTKFQISRSKIQTKITITIEGNEHRTEADLRRLIRLWKKAKR
ncbi:MAG: ParB/RepB/Spo0J family partition protein [Candidatus Pacebacteria bacterium]|nr:ParB/RepB/Spo0J family partition protein [Candidatus Paceibacterota bacterium]